jgi:hypothetical protein
MGHYCYDADVYCEDCLPVDSEDEDVFYDCSGETDVPEHCCVCHTPLDYCLTSEGIDYVLGAMREELARPTEERNKIHGCYDGTYYEGSRHVEITRDWAKELLNYCLSEEDKEFVENFLEETKE